MAAQTPAAQTLAAQTPAEATRTRTRPDRTAPDPTVTELDPICEVVAGLCLDLGLAARYPDADGPLRPTVVRRRNNLIVRCDPFPVAARIANWTASVRDDPLTQLRNEVALSRWASSRKVPVRVPLSGSLAGPHDVDDLVITLWPWQEDGSPATDPGMLGRSLATLHRGTTGFPSKSIGPRQIAADANGVMVFLARLGVLSSDEAMLVADEAFEACAVLETLVARLPVERLVVLHGDATPENTVAGEGQVVWFDLEDTWRGPAEWDLAALGLTPGSSARQIEIATRAYCAESGHVVDVELLHACRRLRHAQLEAWAAVGG